MIALAHTLIALAHTVIALTHLNSTEKLHRRHYAARLPTCISFYFIRSLKILSKILQLGRGGTFSYVNVEYRNVSQSVNHLVGRSGDLLVAGWLYKKAFFFVFGQSKKAGCGTVGGGE